jgi:general secretion pathway protein E
MAHLEIRTPEGTTRKLRLADRPVRIGRHPGNTIVLKDEEASRYHCVIEPVEGRFRIRDLGSRNGTKVNRQRVTDEPLGHGDVVQVGATFMRFVDAAQKDSDRRPDTPDFSSSPLLSPDRAATIKAAEPGGDGGAAPEYQARLREIIAATPAQPFRERDISLIDCRGTTIHEAVPIDAESGGPEIAESIHAFRLLLMTCFCSRATDLHIEPHTDNATVRIRVDGFMIRLTDLELPMFQRLLGVVKILCQFDMSRRNEVQDGHFSVKIKDRRVDYRVSLTPAVHGQKLVVRVLDSSNAPSRLHELGLVPWMYEKIAALAVRDSGMLVACGPTGCGKTTTLYSCLRELNLDQRNAITIEDPIEYYLERCTQIPVDRRQDNTFATILRSVLRQDPDVILVGEIRDTETSTVAMQASMTGHLVYTTVHAKDSVGAIFRLLDLGVEAYLVANAIDMILAQRLVRVLCPMCKSGVRPTPAQTMKIGRHLEGIPEICVPVGCRQCLKTGYKGRRAIFELLEFNDQMRDAVLKEPSIQKIHAIAAQGLFQTLQQSGFHLVAQGVTSIDEIERVAGE